MKGIFGTAIIILFIMLVVWHNRSDKKEIFYQKEPETITELRGYSIIRFKKIQQFINNCPIYYSGVAMSCDGLGSCDSIYFESIAVPKIGPARFEMSYGSQGERSGWILVKN